MGKMGCETCLALFCTRNVGCVARGDLALELVEFSEHALMVVSLAHVPNHILRVEFIAQHRALEQGLAGRQQLAVVESWGGVRV
jgi:hypothetical protein